MTETGRPQSTNEKLQKIYSDALLLSGEPLQVCDKIVQWIAHTLELEIAIIEKIGPDCLEIVSSVQRGEIVREGQLVMTGGPCEQVMNRAEYTYFNDVQSDFPNVDFLVENQVRYYCGVPIFGHQGNVIGILNAMGLQERELRELDHQLLEMMAKRAALELERLRVEEDSHHLQQNLLEIGQEILQHQKVSEILRRVADGIQHHSPFNVVAISLYETPINPLADDEETISEVVLGGLSKEDESKLLGFAKAGDFVSSYTIIQKGKPLGGGYFVSPEMIPELIPKGVRGKTEQIGPQAWGPYDDFYIFLHQDEHIIGRISLGEPISGIVPSEQQLEPLRLFANLAALALDKAQRLEELGGFQKRLEGIYQWNQQLAECENFDDLAELTMQVMIQTFDYDHVSLFNNDGDVLDLVGFETKLAIEDYTTQQFQSIPFGQGIVGHVAQTMEPYNTGDVRESDIYIEGHKDIRAELAVPIVDNNELMGVLNIESTLPDAFGEGDLKLLTALASQLALTVRGILRRQELQWINQFLQGLNKATELEDLLELIINRGIKILAPKADAGSFMLWDENVQAFQFAAAVNRDLESLQKAPLSRESISSGLFEENKPMILTRSSQQDNEILNEMLGQIIETIPGSTISLPIQENGQLIAFLNINNLEKEDVFVERDAARLWDLISEVELALARARDHERLREMAIHDALTDTFNRHFFTEYIEEQSEPELMGDAPISLVMVDIDDFYQVNDRFGHSEGDRILQKVAALIRNEVRKLDMVVRYGGDEFIIIMPQTAEQQAQNVMERLRDKFEAWKPDLPELNLSISFGVASWDPSGNDSLEEVLDKADQFMYHRRQLKLAERRAHKQAIIGGPHHGMAAD